MRTKVFHALAVAALILASLMSLAAPGSQAGNPPPCEDDEIYLDGVCSGPPRDPTPTPPPPATEPVELEATDVADPVDGTEAPPGDADAATVAPSEPTAPSLDEVERRMGNLDSNRVSDLEVFHVVCPAGTDPRSVNFVDSCSGGGTPTFTYTLTRTLDGMFLGSGSLATIEGSASGWYLYSTLEEGFIPAYENLTISYDRVEGYGTAFVSCTITDYYDQGEVIEPPVANGSVTVMGDPGGRISCVWVHVAGLPDDRAGSTPPPSGTGTAPTPGVDGETADGVDITLSAYLCPAGVTAADDLVAACTQPSAGQTFSLLTETATVGSQTSDANGGIFFESVPPYPSGVAISADIPSGYGQPIVLCYQASAGGAVREGELPVLFGNQVRLSTAFGDMVECAWYNVPAVGPDNGPNIYIQAMACGPNGILTPGISVFDATAQCPTAYGGVPFRVTLDGQAVATGATSGDPLSQGQVFFTRLPVGSLVVEAQPSGGAPVLAQFCDQDNGDGNYQVTVSVVGTGSTLDVPLAAGQTMRCTWFFFDEAAVIASQATPVTLDPTPTPAAQGTEVTPRALDPTSEAATRQAAQGTEVTPRALDPTSEAATQQASQGTEVTPRALDPTSEAATAAAILDEPPVPGITLRAWLCPQEMETQQLGDYATVCTVPAEGIAFAIALDGGEPEEQETDGDGAIAFDAPVAGTYLVDPLPVDGLSRPDVTCTSEGADGVIVVFGEFLDGLPGQEIVWDGATEVACEFWFLITDPDALALPVAGDTDDVAAGPPSFLSIAFWTCPAGTDPNAAIADLMATCSIEVTERTVTLTDAAGPRQEIVLGADTWPFQGSTVDIDIASDVTTTFQCEFVWASDDGDVSDDGETAYADIAGSVLSVVVPQPDTGSICDWFVFPDT